MACLISPDRVALMDNAGKPVLGLRVSGSGYRMGGEGGPGGAAP